MAVRVSPITDTDIRRVGEFLNENLNKKLSANQWARSLDVPWSVDSPNSGFMLLDGDTIVGAHLAFYSERMIEGRRERFCNLGAWCVQPDYRFHSLRLLKALLAQEGYTFTDLSPSGNVIGVNEKLGFRSLDTSTAWLPNLPLPSWPGRNVISSDPALIERTLSGDELQLYRDHADTGAARHLVLIRGDEWCYVVFRKDRRKKLPLFASMLHVSHPSLFRRMAGPLGRHLLLRHGALATLVEDRIVEQPPQLAIHVPSGRRRMFRSPRLEPAQIDYLYSELTCVAW
ncbi:MAG TPA: hypothetical protein VHJ37_14490 [Thermoleophilaceae bacterium]|nr:hypothetical protein [Thermoleophilaceae bacterium]